MARGPSLSSSAGFAVIVERKKDASGGTSIGENLAVDSADAAIDAAKEKPNE